MIVALEERADLDLRTTNGNQGTCTKEPRFEIMVLIVTAAISQVLNSKHLAGIRRA